MDFRFQEPDTDVEPIIYRVRAKLEGQKAHYYVRAYNNMRWDVSSTESFGYVRHHKPSLEAALDQARELACRDVKAMVLDAAARRLRES